MYKNIISTGFDHMLFKPGFVPNLLVLEELLFIVTHGIELNRLTEEQTKGTYHSSRDPSVQNGQDR